MINEDQKGVFFVCSSHHTPKHKAKHINIKSDVWSVTDHKVQVLPSVSTTPLKIKQLFIKQDSKSIW
jgi:hypothetical protein